jgi:CoA:oxalate CoA-transferase
VSVKATGDGPLAGITVIDLTRILSGPYCTMMLRDLGARVIKVERPGSGDDARLIGPFIDGMSAYFASINRGKESIDLDLRKDEDRGVFEALLDRGDVLAENFRAGTMEKLGYGWKAIHARWPRLVMTSVSGFGQTGPLRERPAYDMVVQAMGGVMSITGEPGGSPTRVGTSIGDIVAGMFAAYGTVAALHQRHTTGSAAQVDVAMLDGQVALLENAIARYVTTGVVPGPIGSRHPSITPFGVFEAKDGALVLAAGNDALFARLCELLGVAELAGDQRFATNDKRCENEAELRAALERALARDVVDNWLARATAAGIPCAPVQDVAQVLEHPQVRARNMVLPFADPTLGNLLIAGNPVKISTLPERVAAESPPTLGQHRQAILAELGLKG